MRSTDSRVPRSTRSHPRFPLKVPVRIRPLNEQLAHAIQGVSRDICGCGVFVECSQFLTVGQKVSVEVDLAAAYIPCARRLRLTAEGRVVRVSAEHGGIAITAAFELPD